MHLWSICHEQDHQNNRRNIHQKAEEQVLLGCKTILEPIHEVPLKHQQIEISMKGREIQSLNSSEKSF